jgi:hypothetical protein
MWLMGGVLQFMTDEQTALLDMLNPLQIEARYPAYKKQIESVLTNEQCVSMIIQAKEMIIWIEKQL